MLKLGLLFAFAITAPLVQGEAPAQEIVRLRRVQLAEASNGTIRRTVLNQTASGTGVDKSIADLGVYLRQIPHQQVFAGVAGVVGLLCLYSPLQYGRVMIVSSVASVAGLVGGAEAANCWADALGSWGPAYIGMEISVIVAAAAILGFDGFRLIAGSLVGMLLARLVKNLTQDIDGMAALSQPDNIIIWYSCFALLGAIFMAMGNQIALAITGPLFGGLLVSSCLGFFLEEFLGSPIDWFDVVLGIVQEEDPASVFSLGYAHYVCLGVWLLVLVLGLARWFEAGSARRVYDDEEIEFGPGDNGLSKPFLTNGSSRDGPPPQSQNRPAGRNPPPMVPRRR